MIRRLARVCLPAVALAPVLLFPAPSYAAAAAGHGPDWGLLALQVLNTALLLGILARFAGPPIAEFLRQRSHSIRDRIAHAERGLAEARAELAEARRRLEGYATEAETLKRAAEEQARSERERGVERARQAAARIREEARAVADQEIERARRELRREASELAVTLAGEILREHLGPEDDRRIVAEFTERVGATPGNGSQGRAT